MRDPPSPLRLRRAGSGNKGIGRAGHERLLAGKPSVGGKDAAEKPGREIAEAAGGNEGIR